MAKYKKNPYTKRMLCEKLGGITYDVLNTKLEKIGYADKKITEYNFNVILEKIQAVESLQVTEEVKEVVTCGVIETKDGTTTEDIMYNQLVRQYNNNTYLLAVYENELSASANPTKDNYLVSMYSNLQTLQMKLIKQIKDFEGSKPVTKDIFAEF